MSYLALARKWRPATFNQVVGQMHVLTALGNALRQNRLHHAYLFSGTRGVGKTSIGRLFAKGLNCETGITAEPCGICETCKEIDEGRFVDLLEIDAASRTKVEDTRELLDNVQYKPARGRFKVYLIDEVHMLSKHSFNALLKTLEEPPEYVKFLLATTDPQKLPVTILSRCLQFHLKPISVDNIHEQLHHILQQENVGSEQRALGMIAHAADGSMRDALSLTDQAIALGNGEVTTDVVAAMLGTLDTDQAIYLLEAIAHKQMDTAINALHNLAQNGVDWDNLLQELASVLHRIAMYQALPSSLDKSQPDAEKIERLSQHLTPQDIQLYYQIVLKSRQDLPLAPTERMGLEMAVLRMMAFRPASTHAPSAITLPDEPAKTTTAPEPAHVSPAMTATSQPTPKKAEPAQPNRIEQPQPKPVHQPELEQPPMPSEADYPPMPESMPDSMSEPMSDEYDQRDMPSTQPVQSGLTKQDTHQTTETATPKTGLRHQLRSKRQQVSSSNTNGSSSAKKPSAVPSAPVSERMAQQHRMPKTVPHATQLNSNQESDHQGEIVEKEEPYQWRATTKQVEEEREELSPTELKRALEHTKTPEMTAHLINESIAQDKWAALIQKLDIAKLVEQLALNSSYEKQGSTIQLTLRASHAHLNTDKAQSELLNAINLVLGEQCHLTIDIGDKGQTPLELREAIYQSKLKVAHESLKNDDNIKYIQTRFDAELDIESVRPI